MFLLLLILSIFGILKSYSTSVLLLSNVISQFRNYDIVFHHDGTQLEYLEALLKLVENQPKHLITYERNMKNYKISGNRLLHISFLGINQLESLKMNSHQDVAIITNNMVMTENQQEKLCANKELLKIRAVFIVGLIDERFSICCFYCGEKKVSWKTIQTGNQSIPALKGFLNTFKNFRGYTFRIGYRTYAPFFIQEYRNRVNHYEGPEFSILAASREALNFKYTLMQRFSNASSSDSDILTNEVQSGNLDWAIGGISQTLMRTQQDNVEFTKYIQIQGYMIVYKMNEDHRPLFGGQLVQFWYLSNWPSFLLVAGGVVGIASVAKLSLIFSSEKPKPSFGAYAVMTMLYMVEQQSSKFKRNLDLCRPYVKVLFIFWIFTCVYLMANYKSVQAYFLMTSQTGPNSIRDLVKKGYKLQIEYNDFANLQRHCQYMSSVFCLKSMNKMEVFHSDVCGSIKQVLTDKVALIQEEDPLKYTALRQCNLTLNQKQTLRFVPAPIIPTEWHAWPFQKSAAPYIGTFSRLIGRMVSSGLLQYWYKRETHNYNKLYLKVTTELRREPRPLSISDFSHPFALLATGCLIATILHFKEIYNFKRKTLEL